MKDKILDGWEVVKIRKDFITHEPYLAEIQPSIIMKMKSLRNEIEMWKKKYFHAKRLNEDREQKDRFKGRVLDDFDFAAKAKNKFFSSDYGGMYSSGFPSSWNLPVSSTGDES